MSIHNPKNVVGMAELLADDDDGDIDIDAIERSITSGVTTQIKEERPVDMAKEYSKEIEDLGRKFNLKSSKPSRIASTLAVGDEDIVEDTRGIDDLLNWGPYSQPSQKSSQKPAQSSVQSSVPEKGSFMTVEDVPDEEDAEESEKPAISSDYYPSQSSRPVWSASEPKDEQLNRMTNEERKQTHVDRVLSSMEKTTDDADFVQQEDEEDEMAKILEQIDLLKSNLSTEGVDISRIPDVTSNTSKKEARSILKILQIKNDRLRYCDFFEEGILAVAYGLEGFFNGNREVFGSKIDLTGYSDTVKVKLRRMRYDTSNFISGVMQGYNISSGWRIVLELIPSLFLYSRDRRLKAGDTLISDDAYKRAMQNIN
jgi:hypothetical protein